MDRVIKPMLKFRSSDVESDSRLWIPFSLAKNINKYVPELFTRKRNVESIGREHGP